MTSSNGSSPWTFAPGDGPVVAAAIHAGDRLRPEVLRHIALSPPERLREEDPYTDKWTTVADSRVVVHRSRFEVDLNRPRERAIYAAPIDAWGLKVSEGPVPAEVVEGSLRLYDRFYLELSALLDATAERWPRVLVLDLHSYNHRRAGPGEPPADPITNPEVNIGTVGADRQQWGPLIDRFAEALRSCEVSGHQLDVRENVNFRGGHLVRWIADRYPTVCPLAVEVKKIYMDELTGVLHPDVCREVHRALDAATETCRQDLKGG
ncbi:MAG TPA: N-formylglutamate amidohydrolase [Actinomycetota bacterium]|nr:N-formylglutamate amidohydrolase [Actinomycetota bacterium]